MISWSLLRRLEAGAACPRTSRHRATPGDPRCRAGPRSRTRRPRSRGRHALGQAHEAVEPDDTRRPGHAGARAHHRSVVPCVDPELEVERLRTRDPADGELEDGVAVLEPTHVVGDRRAPRASEPNSRYPSAERSRATLRSAESPPAEHGRTQSLTQPAPIRHAPIHRRHLGRWRRGPGTWSGAAADPRLSGGGRRRAGRARADGGEDHLERLDRAACRAGHVADQRLARRCRTRRGRACRSRGRRRRSTRRIASASPGASRSITARVPSGVRSRGPNPVPPVVTTSPAKPRVSSRSAAATASMPSAVTRCSTTSNAGVDEARDERAPGLVLARALGHAVGDGEHLRDGRRATSDEPGHADGADRARRGQRVVGVEHRAARHEDVGAGRRRERRGARR